jgi:hypothetical protein
MATNHQTNNKLNGPNKYQTNNKQHKAKEHTTKEHFDLAERVM